MDNSVRETLVHICDQELDRVALQYSPSIDSEATFSFLVAKVFLYILALVKEKQPHYKKPQSDPQGQSGKYQLLGMAASHRIIDIYCNDLGAIASTGSQSHYVIDSHRVLPKQYFRGLICATFFLLKYFILSSSCTPEHKASSRNKVQMVHAKLRNSAAHQFAEPGRAATVIETLCRHDDASTSEISGDIEDRGVFSLAWSALISASEIRGQPSIRMDFFEKINPASPVLQSGYARNTRPGPKSGPKDGFETSDEDYSLPDSIWDIPFMEMLDFNADGLDDIAD